jgi:hypothetical protein
MSIPVQMFFNGDEKVDEIPGLVPGPDENYYRTLAFYPGAIL